MSNAKKGSGRTTIRLSVSIEKKGVVLQEVIDAYGGHGVRVRSAVVNACIAIVARQLRAKKLTQKDLHLTQLDN